MKFLEPNLLHSGKTILTDRLLSCLLRPSTKKFTLSEETWPATPGNIFVATTTLLVRTAPMF